MRRVFVAILILSFAASAYAIAVFSEVNADPDTDKVTISWMTQSETGVKYFKILRSNDDKTYISLERVNPEGPGTRYEYVDENVMFEEISVVFYKIRAIDQNGQKIDESSLIVHPQISGMFRTWGAIKAMFR